MFRVAIVDDDAASIEQLKSYLMRYQREQGEEMSITSFTDGDEIVENYKAEYDIILMDVEMRFMDGMTAAGIIRQRDQEVIIIFITNMAQYAIKGYQVNATDYVVKPVPYFSFAQSIERAIARINKRITNFIAIGIKGGTVKLQVGDICYVECQGHRMSFHTRTQVFVTFATMKEIEAKLKDFNFFKCNKGNLLNLSFVESVQDGCVIVNGERLVISRARKKEFMEELANYLEGVM